ncbi:helix-turn-helix domain-containing protein [Carnobacterium sp.]|uniref:helix-turn-helix domain-containing protein n=1 Tax=Carnobacterium sp. TaxID=48221 RepID=UPI0038905803
MKQPERTKQMNIGNRIQTIRKSSNMTAKELSKIIEVSPSFISAIENNDSKLSLSTLARICDALGVTLAAFFNEESTVVDTKLNSAISNLPEEKKWQLFNFLEGLFPKK